MNQRAVTLMQGREDKARELSEHLKKIASLYQEITVSSKELAQIAQGNNSCPRRPFISEVLAMAESDRFDNIIESSIKSLLVCKPPVDILAVCEKGNLTFRHMIGGSYE